MKKDEIVNLKNQWIKLVAKYTEDQIIILQGFESIKNFYQSTGRYYHDLSHIENMLSTVEIDKIKFDDLDSVFFAIWFHDIIYNVKRSDNEEKSADLAEMFLNKINYDFRKINKIRQMIIKTKNHQVDEKNDNFDTKLFLDLDLLILGEDSDVYQRYAENIRKEYSIVPDQIYFAERAKILDHFLKQRKIFKTKKFNDVYETIARRNIQTEINDILKYKSSLKFSNLSLFYHYFFRRGYHGGGI